MLQFASRFAWVPQPGRFSCSDLRYGSALIYVGVLMMKGFAKVDMSDLRSAVPAFLALIMMPLTYSISNGIGIGAIAYVLITLFTGKYKKNDIGITIIAALFVIKFIFVTM